MAFVEFPGQPIEQEAGIESTFPRLLIRNKLSPSLSVQQLSMAYVAVNKDYSSKVGQCPGTLIGPQRGIPGPCSVYRYYAKEGYRPRLNSAFRTINRSCDVLCEVLE
jgi:hypothetical protein